METIPARPRASLEPPRPGKSPPRLAAGLLVALCALPVAATAVLRAADQDQPKPQATPMPKASPTPRPSPAPKAPVPAMTPAPGATPKPGSEPSLSFTDFDLERYHRPSPVKDEPSAEEEDEAVGTPSAPGKVSGTPGPMPPGAPATPTAGKTAGRGPQAAKRAQPTPETTQDDPLRPFKDREAKEKFRSEQIQRLRDRLAQIQTRLDYLQGKRQAILDPLTIMPKPPAGEETQGEASMRPKELLQKVDEEIKALKEQQEEAQDQLASVETRFAQESQSR